MKWGGAAVTALVVAAWIASRWWCVGWTSVEGGSWVSLGWGRFDVGRDIAVIGGRAFPGWHVWHRNDLFLFDFYWWFDVRVSSPTQSLGIPLWAPAVLTTALSAAAWRLDTPARRRARVGHCPNCGYDRRGIAPDVPCPECGAVSSTKV